MRPDYIRAVKFPTITWLVAYVLIVVTMKLTPALVITEGVAMGTGFLVILGWSLGAWAGYKTVEFGGNFIDVMFVSAVIAAVAGVLQIVVVGIPVSYPAPVNLAGELPVALWNTLNTLAGALTAGGFALTK